MNNKDLVLVIKREDLSNQNLLFQGFSSIEDNPAYLFKLLNKAVFAYRDDVKGDLNYKEIFTYGILANFEDNRFFVYTKHTKTSSNNAAQDTQITHKDIWSWGISERVSARDDTSGCYAIGRKFPSDKVPLHADLLNKTCRNIFVPGSIDEPKILGFLNHDAENPCRLGIAYLIATNVKEVNVNPRIKPVDSGIEKGYMVRFALLECRLNDSDVIVEPWSKAIMESLRKLYYHDGNLQK